MPAYEILVRGRVQGVGFRAFTQSEALERGVSGWVRNEPDGSVRALLQHADDAPVQDLLRRIGRGPAAARVQGLDITLRGPDPALTGFVIVQ